MTTTLEPVLFSASIFEALLFFHLFSKDGILLCTLTKAVGAALSAAVQGGLENVRGAERRSLLCQELEQKESEDMSRLSLTQS